MGTKCKKIYKTILKSKAVAKKSEEPNYTDFVVLECKGEVPTILELKKHLTKLLKAPYLDESYRVKYTDMLCKSLCMFPQKLEHSGDPERPIKHVYTLGTDNLGGPK